MGRGGGGYARGKNALAHCERCGLRVPYLELRFDGDNPHLSVCSDCWDPEHPQDRLPDTFDPITLYHPTGDLDRRAAGDYITITVPWQLVPKQEMVFGVGIGIGSSYFDPASGATAGDSFDGDSFDTVSFDTDAFDL